MCRMFGFRSAIPGRAHRSLLEAENALADQSQRHPDGWGIGWFIDDEAYVIKSSTAAHSCNRFERASNRLTSHTFLVHVRRATVGHVDHLNAHPFRFGRWLFCHNGTIFSFGEGLQDWLLERTNAGLHATIIGDTDSEHLFYWLLTRLEAEGIDPTGREASDAHVVARIVREALMELDREAIRRNLERPCVNILLSDGRIMVGHRAGLPLYLSTQKVHCADFPTCPATKWCMEPTRPSDGSVNHLILASEPIGADENRWEDMADGTTVALSEDFQLLEIAPPEGWSAPILPERYRLPPVA